MQAQGNETRRSPFSPGRVLALALVLFVGVAAWDFEHFVSRVARTTPAVEPVPGEADAVAALTGASDARIIAAVNLAQRLRAPLLISGVHIDTSAADIAHIAKAPVEQITCCVTLGRTAATTVGNGAEVAEWARRHNLSHIVIVTSNYHMERAMLEMRRSMPEAHFIPYAVASSRTPADDWWRDPETARRLFEEWLKFRTSAMLGTPKQGAPHAGPPPGAAPATSATSAPSAAAAPAEGKP